MQTKLTVIVDNIPQEPLHGEWGLSILAAHRGSSILIDAGASGLFAENMRALGFSIRDIDCAMLSHAHYDHANGMVRFFQENATAKFYLRESAQENCYARYLIFRKYIGLPRHVLTDYKNRIVHVSGDYLLSDGAYLIGHKTPGLSQIGKRERMYQKTARGLVPDDFSHEQSLVLETEKGLLIVNCCSHGGVVNIIREVRETFPGKHVYGYIGGCHLFNKSDAEIRAVAQNIRATGLEFVCTGHCTGQRAYDILKQTLGDRLHQLHVGLEMTF